MRIGTPATGRAERESRRAVATTCSARPATRAAHHLAAPKAQVKRELQGYIPVLIDNDCRSPRPTRNKINRRPGRLESNVTHTKQISATPISRKHLRTLHPAFFAGLVTSKISNRGLRSTSYDSQVTNHGSPIAALLDTNQHFRRNNNSRNWFKTNGRAISYSIQTESVATKWITAGNTRSNRHTSRLENAISYRKQTTAPHSNRHKNALSAATNGVAE
jgi:hypothetical protein